MNNLYNCAGIYIANMNITTACGCVLLVYAAHQQTASLFLETYVAIYECAVNLQ